MAAVPVEDEQGRVVEQVRTGNGQDGVGQVPDGLSRMVAAGGEDGCDQVRFGALRPSRPSVTRSSRSQSRSGTAVEW